MADDEGRRGASALFNCTGEVRGTTRGNNDEVPQRVPGYAAGVPRIVLVDDDATFLETLCLAFEREGYDVATAENGVDALTLMGDEVDLLVTDVNMPLLDGFTLCRQLRECGRTVPIIVLTSRDGEIDEALGLDLGADDYISKPFSTRVLFARVKALLRRSNDSPSDILTHRDLRLDSSRMEVHLCDERVSVTVTEVKLLAAMMRHPGRVFSRERLLRLAREDDSIVSPRIVDTYVARLRRKMKAIQRDVVFIETVVGAGYRMVDDS